MLEEWTTAVEDRIRQKLQDMSVSLSSRLTALERSFKDVVSKQSDVVSVVLPQWQADLNKDIERLRSDLEQQHEKGSKSITEAMKSHHEEALGQCQAMLDGRISAEVATLNQRLAAAGDAAGELKAALSSSSAQLLDANSVLREAMQKQVGELYSTIDVSVTKAVSDIRSSEGLRLQKLEDVVKNLDYERLSRAEKFSRDLDCVHEKLTAQEAAREEALNELARVGRASAAELETLRKDMLQRLSSEVVEVQAKLTAAEERAGSLTTLISGAETRLAEQNDRLASRLEALSASSLAASKTEANNALMKVRADEGVRLAKLEQCMADATKEHDILVGKLDDYRTGLAVVRALAGSKIEANDVPPMLDPLSAVVETLTQKMQELHPWQERQDRHLERLEHMMKEAQARLWPWRQGANNSEPTRVGGGFVYGQEDGVEGQRAAEEGGGGDGRAGATIPEVPQTPRRSPIRPTSAGVGRRPAGAGLAAARNWHYVGARHGAT